MRRVELHADTHGGATVLTASGVHRLNRDETNDMLTALRIRPHEKGLRTWLADRPPAVAGLFYPQLSHKPRAHRFPGCKVCDHKMRDQIEADIDKERSRRGIAVRYGVPVADVREHRRRGRHRT